jgi:hypothetical protein
LNTDAVLGDDRAVCGMCKSAVELVDNVLLNKDVEFVAESVLSYLCKPYLDWDICWGMAH